MLIECRFLFILHPVRLYPLTKQYERKNVAESVGTQFSCNGQIFTSQLVFYFLRVAQRDALFKGDWLVLQVQSIWRSTISKVGSKSCVLSCSFLLEEWYSCKLLYGIQQVSYFKSSQSSQNVSTLPTILLIFFLTVLWWNKLRKIGFIFCNHPILWWSAHWWIWLGLLNLWSPIRKFNLLHSLLSAFTQIFADR